MAGNPDSMRHVNGMGTGVVIDPRGYVITNYHVVEDVEDIRVTLHNGETTNAELIASRVRSDLAERGLVVSEARTSVHGVENGQTGLGPTLGELVLHPRPARGRRPNLGPPSQSAVERLHAPLDDE